jgi:homoserine O-acetyltransferase/O-succinyltransferase
VKLFDPLAPEAAATTPTIEFGLERPLDFEFALPPGLHSFSLSGRASVWGEEDQPVLVVLGGISADRFPGLRPDGVPGWWPGLVGPGKAADPSRFRIVGLDFISDPTGRSAPTSRDQAEAVVAALDHLGIARAHAVIGASYGGMTALALGEQFADRAARLVVISADAAPHPCSTAMRELQRRVVALGQESGRSEEALAIARGMAMLTYRTRDEFAERFEGGICQPETGSRSDAGDYLRARGDAFVRLMSPERFVSLSASIDRHRVDPGAIHLPILLIGADSDQLVPPVQMERLHSGLAGPSDLHLLPSLFGHDMFLKDTDAISGILSAFLEAKL